MKGSRRNTSSKAVPYFRRSEASLSQRRPLFGTRALHANFVVDEVALGQVFPLRPKVFTMSISLHCCSIITHISSVSWKIGPLVAAVSQKKKELSSSRNNKNTSHLTVHVKEQCNEHVNI
jgi:hypothetical protein